MYRPRHFRHDIVDVYPPVVVVIQRLEQLPYLRLRYRRVLAHVEHQVPHLAEREGPPPLGVGVAERPLEVRRGRRARVLLEEVRLGGLLEHALAAHVPDGACRVRVRLDETVKVLAHHFVQAASGCRADDCGAPRPLEQERALPERVPRPQLVQDLPPVLHGQPSPVDQEHGPPPVSLPVHRLALPQVPHDEVRLQPHKLLGLRQRPRPVLEPKRPSDLAGRRRQVPLEVGPGHPYEVGGRQAPRGGDPSVAVLEEASLAEESAVAEDRESALVFVRQDLDPAGVDEVHGVPLVAGPVHAVPRVVVLVSQPREQLGKVRKRQSPPPRRPRRRGLDHLAPLVLRQVRPGDPRHDPSEVVPVHEPLRRRVEDVERPLEEVREGPAVGGHGTVAVPRPGAVAGQARPVHEGREDARPELLPEVAVRTQSLVGPRQGLRRWRVPPHPRVPQRRDRRETRVGIALHETPEEVPRRRAQVSRPPQGGGRVPSYPVVYLVVRRRAVGIEGVYPHEHDVDYDAEGPDVGRLVGRTGVPCEPLRGPVRLGPDVARPRRRVRASSARRGTLPAPVVHDGAPEVDDLERLGPPVRAEEDVLRLEVRVDHPHVVEEGEGRQHLGHESTRVELAVRAVAAQRVEELPAGGQVEEEAVPAAVLVHVAEAADVGMPAVVVYPQQGRGLRPEEGRPVRVTLRQDLEGDGLAGRRDGGAVDAAVGTLA
mmetsp:Transcript_937/g.1968  ORF Transcript_937/g.1968 Transcript_937/m.1968 type:complete len:711 (-) Transcript_937:409-2541(-)